MESVVPICDSTIEMKPVLTVEEFPKCLPVDPSTIYRCPTGDDCRIQGSEWRFKLGAESSCLSSQPKDAHPEDLQRRGRS